MNIKKTLLLTLISFLCLSINAQYILDEALINKTCLIKDAKTHKNMGSGFFIFSENNNSFFCTAGHVFIDNQKLNSIKTIFNTDSVIIQYLDAHNPKEIPGELKLNLREALIGSGLKFHSKGDVVVVLIGKLKLKSQKGSGFSYSTDYKPWCTTLVDKTKSTFNRKDIRLYDDVKISSEIMISGYPLALDIPPNKNSIDFKYPLLKKGIIAGKNRKLKTFIIDGDVHYGNSGSPVFAPFGDKMRLIGLVSQKTFYETGRYKQTKHGMQYINEGSVSNSGYSVVTPVDYIDTIINKFK